MERNRNSGLNTGASSNCPNSTEKRGVLIRWNRLRVEATDGSQGTEYRIEDGRVESRNLNLTPQTTGESADIGWQRLTSGQLTAHVRDGTVLAKWLSRRMGIEPLLLACFRNSLESTGVTPDRPHTREVFVREFSPWLTKTSHSGAECLTNG